MLRQCGLVVLLSIAFTDPTSFAAERGAAAEPPRDTATAGPAAIPVGNLVDFSGRTAVVGKAYGQGKIDAFAYINAHGGIKGRPLKVLTEDYSYILPKAIAAYRRWVEGDDVVAIQGWGTSDTEALIHRVAEDQIPFFSASYSGRLTDPRGESEHVGEPAPYNFFVGPSYSDGVRGLIQWARHDWEAKGRSGPPTYVHMGDEQPYPEAARGPGEAYAREQGFTVLPAQRYSLNPADFTGQCRWLKEHDVDYAYLANTSNANIRLLRDCHEIGVRTQFMASIWGYDETVMDVAGAAADGVVWVMGAAKWGAGVPGMDLVKDISAMSGDKDNYRPVHYIRGICSVYYMKEAMEIAMEMKGGITGPNIKSAMYVREDWVPAGLEGVCPPATWTATDHRGVNQVMIYQGHVTTEDRAMERVYTAVIPRKDAWLGW